MLVSSLRDVTLNVELDRVDKRLKKDDEVYEDGKKGEEKAAEAGVAAHPC